MTPKEYKNERNQMIAYPMGGIGAGMLCLEGTGTFSHVSVYHRPEIFCEPNMFAALCIQGESENTAVCLEGQVPSWKIYSQRDGGFGMGNRNYGLARFRDCIFSAEFPFGKVRLEDEGLPVSAEITGWSPFIPNDADNSSLPVAAVEYTLTNRTDRNLETVFSFHCTSFLSPRQRYGGRNRVTRTKDGILLHFLPENGREFDRAWFSFSCDQPGIAVDPRWFRGFMFDGMMNVWKHVQNGDLVDNQPFPEEDLHQSYGGSVYAPVSIPAGESRTVTIRFSWYVPQSDLRAGVNLEPAGTPLAGYKPWYAVRFDSIQAVSDYWAENYASLRRQTRLFIDTLYRSTLDDEIMDAVTSNLCILKSPTVLRQEDGRLWCWEGCGDDVGSCHGSCTHVWNYAQAFCHLFPDLERTLRQTEFHESQDERGHQNFRSSLPIRPCDHEFHAAADGQLGGIIKVYRDYRISGDREWLQELWPFVKKSINYCIDLWDPAREGQLKQPHHNTYDIEFWGPDGMNQSIYVAALRAMILLCADMGEDGEEYTRLYHMAKEYLETELFNGRYYIQKVMYKELNADFAKIRGEVTPESQELLKKEGPHYQYGNGCLSDGIIGDWMGFAAGLEETAEDGQVKAHLDSVYRYNFRGSLLRHSNAQRPGYAYSQESGLLLCSWPDGDKPTLPFIYSDEVWTGIEYQVAAHMASKGMIEQARDIVRGVRSRYDGRVRNPFNEYECGHWYARALASYSLLQGYTGIRYDAVDKVLTIRPSIEGDFASFLCTAFGYGLAGVENGKPFFRAVSGKVEIDRIAYYPVR